MRFKEFINLDEIEMAQTGTGKSVNPSHLTKLATKASTQPQALTPQDKKDLDAGASSLEAGAAQQDAAKVKELLPGQPGAPQQPVTPNQATPVGNPNVINMKKKMKKKMKK